MHVSLIVYEQWCLLTYVWKDDTQLGMTLNCFYWNCYQNISKIISPYFAKRRHRKLITEFVCLI